MDAIFTHALQVETAMLQAQHPILAAVIGRAHALLVDGKVFPEDDGRSAVVQSSTDPTLFYHVNGHCTCKAQEFHDAPCKHRLSLRMYQRVCERLAEEHECYDLTQDPAVPAATPLPEAPASVNCHITIAGRQVQLTLRDTDETRLLARLETVLQQYPVPVPATQEPTEGWCVPHGVQMRWNPGKDGKAGWWSHKAPEGQWCKGKGGAQ
jgi:hypothetical protein